MEERLEPTKKRKETATAILSRPNSQVVRNQQELARALSAAIIATDKELAVLMLDGVLQLIAGFVPCRESLGLGTSFMLISYMPT